MKNLKKSILLWCGGSITTTFVLLLVAAKLLSSKAVIFLGILLCLIFMLCIYDSIYTSINQRNSWGTKNAVIMFLVFFAITLLFALLKFGTVGSIIALIGGLFCVTIIIYHGFKAIAFEILEAYEKIKNIFLG